MNTHLQYHIEDKVDNIIDDENHKIDYTIFNARAYKYIATNENEIVLTPLVANNYDSTDDFENKKVSYNKKFLELYSSYKNNLKVIREDTDDAIKSFINNGGKIKDLLYRMNTMDPIEREFYNRSVGLITFNDNFNNFITNYKNSGKDDMVTTGIMNHEVNAILLYLLSGSNVKIKIDYNPYKLINFIYRTSGIKECIEVNSNFSINPSPSYKWFLLQSLYDSKFINKIPFICDLSKENQSKYIVNGEDDTLGKVYINKDISFSLAMIILRLYKHNTLFEEESIHNMCRLPVYLSSNIPTNIDNLKIKDLYNFFMTEEFRKIMHTTSIIFYQLLIFNFMEYLIKELNLFSTEIKNPIDKHLTEIKNPIDKHLFENREFQKIWILIEENCDSKKLFKLFKLFKDYFVNLLVEEKS